MKDYIIYHNAQEFTTINNVYGIEVQKNGTAIFEDNEGKIIAVFHNDYSFKAI
jgi:hypothetical protein